MELALDLNKRYTYADYLTWTDDKMRQLFNGFIKMMSPAPKSIHQKIVTALAADFIFIIRKNKGKCQAFVAPFDVRLPKNNEKENDKIHTVVQPDVCVICDPDKIDERGCIGAPDFVAEIISVSSLKYDTQDKFKIYEEAGVKEYWIITPYEGVTVFILQENGKYDEGTVYELNEKIPVHIFGGIKICLQA